MAGNNGPLSHGVWKSRARNGEAGILRLARPGVESGLGLCARFVEVDDVPGQAAARFVHARVPQVSRGMEDCARPYFGGGVKVASRTRPKVELCSRQEQAFQK